MDIARHEDSFPFAAGALAALFLTFGSPGAATAVPTGNSFNDTRPGSALSIPTNQAAEQAFRPASECPFPAAGHEFGSGNQANPEDGETIAASAETSQGAPGRDEGRSLVFKDRVTPHWFQSNTRFWYRNDLRNGVKEFIVVDAEHGTREPAFDHAKLAVALSKAAGGEFNAEKLPFEGIDFSQDNQAIRFKIGAVRWRCDLPKYEVREDPGGEDPVEKNPDKPPGQGRAVPRRSARTGAETSVTFVNRTAGEAELFWLDTEGARQSYGKLAPNEEHFQHTFAGHVWLAVDSIGSELMRIEVEPDSNRIEIASPPAQPRPSSRPRRDREDSDRSPDGRWMAFVKEYNVFIKTVDGDAGDVQLSRDGREGFGYGRFSWAPDSKTLVAFRIEPGERKDVYLIQSSPPEGGRALLKTRPYALPGDKFTTYELNLFNVAERSQMKPETDRFEHEWETPRVHWRRDSGGFAYPQVDRGHQRFRVIQVDARTGAVRNVIDERTGTFIWTAHTEDFGPNLVNWLEQTDEIIYASERDVWRHLYLVDAREGGIRDPITKGDWVVRGIDRIDEDARQIWFRASGRNPAQDPYLIQYYRVNFDGTDLVALTEGNGNHRVQYSPDQKYLVDTYSRVDLAPVNELRRASDGKLVCPLEEADITDLKLSGWRAPEVFVVKGRDGGTDIWGIICRPRDFQSNRKYPVIEDIYSGPQGSFVPKTFSPVARYESLTRLGFIVVKIDGMGTANRSKAFHDVCWKNLKDAGFEDRILWMKAAAGRYPGLDLARVGIYGTSAGAQNAAAAVLFHPEFYRVAVANCGCHDNRMDKASWNEQWMGYPVGPQYSECSNIDHAENLRGHLFLIVGEMDTNVPPESTLRFVDALVRAKKDFDLLVVPNADHGIRGPRSAYAQRRMNDFFARHLLGEESPDRNAGSDVAK